VQTVDEGIGILTGRDAGERQEDGTYPVESVNYLVDAQLRELAIRLKDFGKEEDKKETEEES
jgi:hypothetical protein